MSLPEGGTSSTSGSGSAGGGGSNDGGAPPGGTSSAAGSAASSTSGSAASSTSGAGGASSTSGSGTCAECDAGNNGAAATGAQNTNANCAADRSACLPTGPIAQVSLPAKRGLSPAESALVKVAVYGVQIMGVLNPLTATQMLMLIAARKYANSQGCLVALGAGGDAIGIGGVSAGYGVYWDPSGTVGAYGSAALDAGFFAGLSVEVIVTLIKGDASAFSGDCYAVGGGGGEVVAGSVFYLYATNGSYLGVSMGVGGGGGMPYGAYAQMSHTWITPPTN